MELYSFTYSIPYILFLAYLIVLMFVEFRFINQQKNIRNVRWATIIGFLFFFGLRGFVYTDWVNYHYYYQQLSTIWQGGLLSVFSPQFLAPDTAVSIDFGFTLFSVLIKSLGANYFFWIFINTFIDVLLLNAVFKRYSKYYVLCFIAFFAFGGIEIGFNLMRNIKAVLLFLLSLQYLQERKLLPYVLLNMLGMCFHISSVLFLPLYFVLHRAYSKSFYWTIFAVGNVIFLFNIEYLQPMANFCANLIGGRVPDMVHEYFRVGFSVNTFGFGYIERVLTFLLAMLFFRKLTQQNSSNIIFINLFILFFVCFFFFSEAVILSERTALLFIAGYWVLYPNLYTLISRVSNKKIVLMLFITFAMAKTIRNNHNISCRYDNVLWGVQSYEERKQILEETVEIFIRN